MSDDEKVCSLPEVSKMALIRDLRNLDYVVEKGFQSIAPGIYKITKEDSFHAIMSIGYPLTRERDTDESEGKSSEAIFICNGQRFSILTPDNAEDISYMAEIERVLRKYNLIANVYLSEL